MHDDNVVIFDGACNLCARSVRFILDHELGLDPEDAKTFTLRDTVRLAYVAGR